MSDDLENTPESECTVCYAAHDEEIHQATLSIHRWFHHQVTHDFEDEGLYLPEFGIQRRRLRRDLPSARAAGGRHRRDRGLLLVLVFGFPFHAQRSVETDLPQVSTNRGMPTDPCPTAAPRPNAPGNSWRGPVSVLAMHGNHQRRQFL